MPPRLILEINGFWSCNFNCPTCSTKIRGTVDPVLLEDEKLVSYETREPIIRDYLATYPTGDILIQGGEPLFYFDKFVEITTKIKANFPSINIETISNCSRLLDEKA